MIVHAAAPVRRNVRPVVDAVDVVAGLYRNKGAREAAGSESALNLEMFGNLACFQHCIAVGHARLQRNRRP